MSFAKLPDSHSCKCNFRNKMMQPNVRTSLFIPMYSKINQNNFQLFCSASFPLTLVESFFIGNKKQATGLRGQNHDRCKTNLCYANWHETSKRDNDYHLSLFGKKSLFLH